MLTCYLLPMQRLAFLLLAACHPPPDASEMLVYDYVGLDGEHALQPVPLGAVTDPVRMETDIGPATRGARFTRGFDIVPGGPVHVEHTVVDDVFVPLDEQGLVLASFFHHIDEARQDLESRGHAAAADSLLPVDAVMWSPVFVGELGAAENAAFIDIETFAGFILYNDANNNVPLGAHAGVVRHELGHGYLANYLESYSGLREWELDELGVLSTVQARGLNEGFADMLAHLTLDDPGALPLGPERDPREPRTYNDVVLDQPYSMGVVLAALAWDVRIILDDPDRTFDHVLVALKEWERRLLAGEFQPIPAMCFGAVLIEQVIEAHPELTEELCDAFDARYQGWEFYRPC